MDFFINKNATLPILRLELIKDGETDYNKLHDMIQNSVITFCMTDAATGVKRIGNKEALCILKEDTECCGEQYMIGYKFTEKDTSKAGVFIGEFTIKFNDDSGTLIVPIREVLNIHVLDKGIKR